HAVVSRNAGRKDKKLWTDRGAGTSITVFDAYNEYEEAEFVARQVERLSGGAAAGSMARLLTRRADDEEGGLRYGDIAVGYRINAKSRVLEDAVARLTRGLRDLHAPADGDGSERDAERGLRRGARAQRPQGRHQRRDR